METFRLPPFISGEKEQVIRDFNESLLDERQTHEIDTPPEMTCDVDQYSLERTDWVKSGHFLRTNPSWKFEDIVLVRLESALVMLSTCIDVDPEVRGGIPVLKDTRFPVARLLAEIGSGMTIQNVADEYDLDLNTIKVIFDGMAAYFDRPISR